VNDISYAMGYKDDSAMALALSFEFCGTQVVFEWEGEVSCWTCFSIFYSFYPPYYLTYSFICIFIWLPLV